MSRTALAVLALVFCIQIPSFAGEKQSPIDTMSKSELKQSINEIWAEIGKVTDACNASPNANQSEDCRKALEHFNQYRMVEGENLYCGDC